MEILHANRFAAQLALFCSVAPLNVIAQSFLCEECFRALRFGAQNRGLLFFWRLLDLLCRRYVLLQGI